MVNEKKQFPEKFLWGATTSAYQIEGDLINDWSEWEKSPKRLAELKKKKFNPADFQSGLACNSWNMLEADIKCLKTIDATAYRFSVDWSRIEPEEGRFDEAALNRYASFVARLQEEGIEPFVTLWHWPLPLWLREKGGWASKSTIGYFKKFAERVVMAMPTVKFWMTINEPLIYANHSYLIGDWPPCNKNVFTYLRVLKNLSKAHKTVFDLLKDINPLIQVGIAAHLIYFEAESGLVNKTLKKLADWWFNNRFLDQIKDKQDFIGLNFYMHNLINYGFYKNKNGKMSDFGWELYPAGIYNVLLDLSSRYQKPVYITENGLADEKDINRVWYIKEILTNLLKAINDGVDVRGYLYWSLLDNFEWAEGFTKKFGLFTVDPKTFERRPRPSAMVYAEIIKTNSL